MSKPWIAIWTASKYNAQILAAAFAVRIAARAGTIFVYLLYHVRNIYKEQIYYFCSKCC